MNGYLLHALDSQSTCVLDHRPVELSGASGKYPGTEFPKSFMLKASIQAAAANQPAGCTTSWKETINDPPQVTVDPRRVPDHGSAARPTVDAWSQDSSLDQDGPQVQNWEHDGTRGWNHYYADGRRDQHCNRDCTLD